MIPCRTSCLSYSPIYIQVCLYTCAHLQRHNLTPCLPGVLSHRHEGFRPRCLPGPLRAASRSNCVCSPRCLRCYTAAVTGSALDTVQYTRQNCTHRCIACRKNVATARTARLQVVQRIVSSCTSAYRCCYANTTQQLHLFALLAALS